MYWSLVTAIISDLAFVLFKESKNVTCITRQEHAENSVTTIVSEYFPIASVLSYLFIYLFIHSFTYLLTYSLTYLFKYLFIFLSTVKNIKQLA